MFSRLIAECRDMIESRQKQFPGENPNDPKTSQSWHELEAAKRRHARLGPTAEPNHARRMKDSIVHYATAFMATVKKHPAFKDPSHPQHDAVKKLHADASAAASGETRGPN